MYMSATESEEDTASETPLFVANEKNTDDDVKSAPPTTKTSQFGESVSLKPPKQSQKQDDTVIMDASTLKKRNAITAVLAICVAILNYAWQYTHPITSLSLLTEMQSTSSPLSIIGTNNKPTVVDFWAPWCENCKLMAPTLKNVELSYSDSVNFCMVNGDLAESWPAIEAFGVDAIPHLALVSKEGNVETALIGPIPKSVLQADLDILIQNAKSRQDQQEPLPFQMLDVFKDDPDKRRVHFDP